MFKNIIWRELGENKFAKEGKENVSFDYGERDVRFRIDDRKLIVLRRKVPAIWFDYARTTLDAEIVMDNQQAIFEQNWDFTALRKNLRFAFHREKIKSISQYDDYTISCLWPLLRAFEADVDGMQFSSGVKFAIIKSFESGKFLS